MVINFNSISAVMSMHRIRLNDPQINNQSFSHQQSVNQHCETRHKKKTSHYQKPSRTPNYHRLKTDQKQSSAILKNQPLNSCAASIHLVHNANSASKLSKGQQRIALPQRKKSKRAKQTISVINLSKNLEDSKAKASSTVTKRKQSAVDFSEKIKEKTQDFKIISNCLEEYVREERRNNSQANLSQIMKIIGAFNRSQIAPISKPLEKLIGVIVNSIQFSLPKPQLKSILKKSISFESPNRNNEPEDEQGTVKKGISSHSHIKEGQQTVGDVKRLEENLTKLKYESNRLKYFLQEISHKSRDKRKGERGQSLEREEEKMRELMQLKQIAEEQARIIQQLQDSSDQNDTFRSSSSN